MLLENNCIEHDDDDDDGDEYLPLVDREWDTLMNEYTTYKKDLNNVPRPSIRREESAGQFLNFPSNLPTRRRLRGGTWFLNSTAYHPRLVYIMLGK